MDRGDRGCQTVSSTLRTMGRIWVTDIQYVRLFGHSTTLHRSLHQKTYQNAVRSDEFTFQNRKMKFLKQMHGWASRRGTARKRKLWGAEESTDMADWVEGRSSLTWRWGLFPFSPHQRQRVQESPPGIAETTRISSLNSAAFASKNIEDSGDYIQAPEISLASERRAQIKVTHLRLLLAQVL